MDQLTSLQNKLKSAEAANNKQQANQLKQRIKALEAKAGKPDPKPAKGPKPSGGSPMIKGTPSEGDAKVGKPGAYDSGKNSNVAANAKVLLGPRPDAWGRTDLSEAKDFVVTGAKDYHFKNISLGPGAVGGRGELYIYQGAYDFWNGTVSDVTVPFGFKNLMNYMFQRFVDVASLARQLKKPINTGLAITITPVIINGWVVSYATARHQIRLLQTLAAAPTNLSLQLTFIQQVVSNYLSDIESAIQRLAGVPVPPWFAAWIDTCMAGVFAKSTDSALYMIDATGTTAGTKNLWLTQANVIASVTAILGQIGTSLNALSPTTPPLTYIWDVFTVMYGQRAIEPLGIHLDEMTWHRWRTVGVNASSAGVARLHAPLITNPPNNDGAIPMLIEQDSWKDGTNEGDIYLSAFREQSFFTANGVPGSGPAAFTFSDPGSTHGIFNSFFGVDGLPHTLPTDLGTAINWRDGDPMVWLDATDAGIVNYNLYTAPWCDYSMVEVVSASLADMTQELVDRMFRTDLIL